MDVVRSVRCVSCRRGVGNRSLDGCVTKKAGQITRTHNVESLSGSIDDLGERRRARFVDRVTVEVDQLTKFHSGSSYVSST
jgi:hypothetical protein